MTDQAQLLPGTLDLLILRAVSLGPLHGYGILLRIGQISGGALTDRTGRALSRAVPASTAGTAQGELGHIGNNRRAKFYELTVGGPQAPAAGNRELEQAGDGHRHRR